MLDQCFVLHGQGILGPGLGALQLDFMHCWNISWGRAADSGLVQSWLFPTPGSNSWKGWGMSWEEVTDGKKVRAHIKVLSEPCQWLESSQTCTLNWPIHVFWAFPRSSTHSFFSRWVFYLNWSPVIHHSCELIHDNIEYANILGVFCMFQNAELLTAFIMGLLLDWYLLRYLGRNIKLNNPSRCISMCIPCLTLSIY